MHFCRPEDAAASQTRREPDEKTLHAEWPEPPGRLGEYVRRVKRLRAAAPPRAGA